MPKVRRIAPSSRVSAAKRASELEETTNIQRNRASAVVISSARPVPRCASASVVPTTCIGSTPTWAPPRAVVRVRALAARLRPRLGARDEPRLDPAVAAEAVAPAAEPRGRRPHAAAAGPRISASSFCVSSDGCGVQQVGQHGAAAVVGLDRHAALAARDVRPHQRPPGAFMRPVDLQQPLRRRDRRFRLGLLAQQRLGDACGHGRAAARVPRRARRRRSGRSRPDPPAGRRPAATATRGWSVVARITSSTSTQTAPGAQRQVVAGDLHDLRGPAGDSVSSSRWISCRSDARACSSGRRLHSSSASLPRSAGRGERQRDDRQQRPRLAPGRQHVFAGERPGFHLADQPQPEHHLSGRRGCRL